MRLWTVASGLRGSRASSANLDPGAESHKLLFLRITTEDAPRWDFSLFRHAPGTRVPERCGWIFAQFLSPPAERREAAHRRARVAPGAGAIPTRAASAPARGGCRTEGDRASDRMRRG